MPSVDEKLLAKLVSKFGVDKEPQQTARSRLWGRVVKEYNTITDNNVSRQKIVKKWQNITYQKKIRAEKLLESLNKYVKLSPKQTGILSSKIMFFTENPPNGSRR